MLRTICMWTQLWSDIPSRSALTCAMYHQPRTWSSALTASMKLSRRRLPRVGARTCASAIASARRLAGRSAGIGLRGRLLHVFRFLRSHAGIRRPGQGRHFVTDRRSARGWSRTAVKERGAVVLFGLGGGGGIATAADRFPGPLVKLVFAAVGAAGGNRLRIAAGLTGGDRFERRLVTPPGRFSNCSRRVLRELPLVDLGLGFDRPADELAVAVDRRPSLDGCGGLATWASWMPLSVVSPEVCSRPGRRQVRSARQQVQGICLRFMSKRGTVTVFPAFAGDGDHTRNGCALRRFGSNRRSPGDRWAWIL